MIDEIELMKKIDEYNYIDLRVYSISCECFGDEVTIFHEGARWTFVSCLRVIFDHYWGNCCKDKPMRYLSMAQIPFFILDMNVKIENMYDIEVYSFDIHLSPLKMKIVCKDLLINGFSVNDYK